MAKKVKRGRPKGSVNGVKTASPVRKSGKRGRPKGSVNNNKLKLVDATPKGKRGRPKADPSIAVKELQRELVKVNTKLRKMKAHLEAVTGNTLLKKVFGIAKPRKQRKSSARTSGKRGRPAKTA